MVLGGHKTVSFTAHYWVRFLDDPDLGNELISGQTLAVRVTERNELRVEDVSLTSTRYPGYFVGCPYDLFVSNGTTQIEIARASNIYHCGLSASDLVGLKSRFGLVKYIVPQVIFSRHLPSGFAPATDRIEPMEGVDVLEHVTYRDDEQIVDRIYIQASENLPVRISSFAFRTDDELTEVLRTDYSNWRFNEELSPEQFDVTPPYGMRPTV